MVEGIIFDMDGVIIDSEPKYIEIEVELYKELGIQMTREEKHRFMGMGMVELWQRIKDEYSVELDPEIWAKREEKIYFEYLFGDEDKVMMEGVDELLDELVNKRHLKVALASSSSHRAISHVLKIFDIKKYFDVQISAEDVTYSKPAPDIFLKAAEALGVPPEKCLVIEDSRNGITAAKKAGMLCVGFASAPEGYVDYSKADGKIDRHKDFLPLMEEKRYI